MSISWQEMSYNASPLLLSKGRSFKQRLPVAVRQKAMDGSPIIQNIQRRKAFHHVAEDSADELQVQYLKNRPRAGLSACGAAHRGYTRPPLEDLADARGGSEGGGIYLFDDEAASALLSGPIIAGLRASRVVSDISVKLFDVTEAHTAITRGPVGSGARGRMDAKTFNRMQKRRIRPCRPSSPPTFNAARRRKPTC